MSYLCFLFFLHLFMLSFVAGSSKIHSVGVEQCLKKFV